MNEHEKVFTTIHNELHRAESIHPPIKTPHEGYAVIQEEIDELWECIKSNNLGQAAVEARQIGAMAARFLLDLYTQT